MHYSIDCYVAARLALSASLRLDKRSSFCSAVSAERRSLSYSLLRLNLSSLSIILQFSSLMRHKKYGLDAGVGLRLGNKAYFDSILIRLQ